MPYWVDLEIPGPSARYAHAATRWQAAGPPAADLAVLFGGVRETESGDVYYGDTWHFNGALWTDVSPVSSPSARCGHRLSYLNAVDPEGTEKVLLFGGTDGEDDLTDTWIYDPATTLWDEYSLHEWCGAPTRSTDFGMTSVYSPAAGNYILYVCAPLVPGTVETWHFWGADEMAWSQDAVAGPTTAPYTDPDDRVSFILGYDPVRDEALLVFCHYTAATGEYGYELWGMATPSTGAHDWTLITPGLTEPTGILPANRNWNCNEAAYLNYAPWLGPVLPGGIGPTISDLDSIYGGCYSWNGSCLTAFVPDYNVDTCDPASIISTDERRRSARFGQALFACPGTGDLFMHGGYSAYNDDGFEAADTRALVFDVTEPWLSTSSPAEGSSTSERTPTITERIYDTDTGIDPESVVITITVTGPDGETVTEIWRDRTEENGYTVVETAYGTNGYTYTITPPSAFSVGATVSVSIACADNELGLG